VCGTSTASCTNKVERIQERGLRFVFSDFTSSYETLLSKANTGTLQLQRLKSIACEVFKSVNGLGPAYTQDLFKTQSRPYNTRHKLNVNVPSVRTTKYGINSLKYKGACIWNNLPDETRSVLTIDEFQQLLSVWSGPRCKCNMCKYSAK
jgi:hypothetical protein